MAATQRLSQGARIAPVVDIESLDHLVLTVHDIEVTCRFYRDVLGMRVETFGEGRTRLRFGSQALNLHEHGNEVSPHAGHVAPGSGDLCFIARTPIEGVVRSLEEHGIAIEQGPVERFGAEGRLLSVYVRDPDANLVEVANRLAE